MKKTITIFGSTGSIGQNTIDIIRRSPEKYQVVGLAAKDNYKLLAEQAIKLQAHSVCIYEEKHLPELKKLLNRHKINIYTGEEGIISLCQLQANLVVAAIVGAAGLISTYHAIINGSDIALANKESLVCGGNLIMNAAKQHEVKILPTDSEHNAIFQVFEENNRKQIEKIILTASGGPFLHTPIDQLKNITVEQATNHPNWKMGKKITVDCSNLVNKGLEMIEAHYLFNLPASQIDILIHPQSIIHSMVCYMDGSTLAQLGNPDMRTPIAYSLDWPKRADKKIVETLNLAKLKQLDFFECDTNRFPAVNICRDAINSSGNAQIILNAANEIAVENFLNKKIQYINIIQIIENMLNNKSSKPCTSIEEVIDTDEEFRIKTQEYIDAHII